VLEEAQVLNSRPMFAGADIHQVREAQHPDLARF
jgi:hypothetical protein